MSISTASPALRPLFALLGVAAVATALPDSAEGRRKAPPPREVKPPTADDLATYTADLGGEGTLTATLVTSQGTIRCELFEKRAPRTVANFVGLARGLHSYIDPGSGKPDLGPFYDDTIFHRVIPDFMIQAGDPLGRGNGGPGYRFADEIDPTLRHDRPGIMSMANSGPNTNGSQFFITEQATAHLDGKHTVFGACRDLAVIKKIARVPKAKGERSKPAVDVVLQKVIISREVAPATGPLPDTLVRSNVSAGVRRVQDKVRACVELHPFEGKLDARLTITPAGAVSDVQLSAGAAGFKACVTEALKSATFARSKRGGTVSYPFIFN